MRLLSFLNCVRCWTNFTFVHQRVSPFWFVFQELRRSDPINHARVYRPTSILHPKKWFLILETDVCFLHIQLIETNVWLPKMHNVPPGVDFESSRCPAKSESWNSPNLHCLAVFPTWQDCLYSLVKWKEIKRAGRLSHAFVHFVIDRASLFTNHRISSLPIRAKSQH